MLSTPLKKFHRSLFRLVALSALVFSSSRLAKQWRQRLSSAPMRDSSTSVLLLSSWSSNCTVSYLVSFSISV